MTADVISPDEERLAAMDRALVRIREAGAIESLEAEAVSYGMMPFDLAERWDEAVARFRNLVERLSNFVGGSVESGAQARSVLGWTGDLATVWAGAVAPEQRRAHFQSVEAEVRYRVRVASIVTAAIESAAAICAAAASPLMAPGALRSLARLVSELQRLG